MKGWAVGKIELHPLGEESLGVRSMALGVVTPDATVLLDAGVSLAPRRFGLPPHPKEFEAAREARERITSFAARCDVVTISHYHLDHYTPSFTSYYEWCDRDVFEKTYAGKLILAKRPDRSISFNQRKRAAILLRELGEAGCRVVEADGLRFVLGRTYIEALGPFPHGAESPMGSVVSFLIEYGGTRIVFAPDAQGPTESNAAEAIISLKPSLVVIGGPPLYLEGRKVERELVRRGLENLSVISRSTRVIVCHHTLRDEEWRGKLASGGISAAMTYAELLGAEEKLLEARRRVLYKEEPPSRRFIEWLRAPKDSRGPPPL
ncbi:MAG: hypothetical protein QXJ59_03985 [Thermofilaceae archaeon]